MKKLLLIILIFAFTFVRAQVTNEGEPVSWSLLGDEFLGEMIDLPSQDLKIIKKEDALNAKETKKPYRISYAHKVNYTLENTNNWTQLPNGDRIWKILFHSKDALHLSAVFDKFYIPEGANLYLYNDDKTDLQGAYTKHNNNEKQQLGTWFVNGDKLWIEYFEPNEVRGQGKLSISSILHGYRLGHTYQKGYFDSKKSLDDSGHCNHDVDCPIGDDFENMKDILKKSVAFMLMPDGAGAFVCSGSLINTTAQDKKPYFLTANHCYERDNGTTRNEALFSMRFNWISPNPVCGSSASSADAAQNLTMNGSSLKARNSGSDFMLLEFNTNIPDTWDVVYAGWDKTDTDPTFEVGIHHPRGDIMKVCRDDSGATKTTSSGVDLWLVGGISAGTGNGWEIGVTEGGSSGSPLFNQNGHIIGQLFAGLAACIGIANNNDYDIYGRFATSWDAGSSPTNSLKGWLDPNNLNPNTLDELKNVLATNDEVLEQNLTLFPNPTSGLIQVSIADQVGELKYEVFNLLGQNLKSSILQKGESINISTFANSIYLIKITDIDRNASLTKKIVLSK